jgi:hypothetical protein
MRAQQRRLLLCKPRVQRGGRSVGAEKPADDHGPTYPARGQFAGSPLNAGATAAVGRAVSNLAEAQFPAVCELKVVIPSAPRRLTRMKWVVEALAGDLNETSEFLDGVEYEPGHMSIYLYGTDPVRLVQVTRRALDEFHLLTGATGVVKIAGDMPAGSVFSFWSRPYRSSSYCGKTMVTVRNRTERFPLSDSESARDVQRL